MSPYKFSLLITVYRGTRVKWLNGCLVSVRTQDRQPSEIVMVQDGPISEKLDRLIIEWQKVLPIIRIKLVKNTGPGGAAQAGFMRCSHPWIARLDADDIAMPTRFSQQLAYLSTHPDLDVLGGQIAEFNEDEQRLQTIRQVPLLHQDIESLMFYRCPINNTSVIFRRQRAIEAGGYETLISHEDYLLWCKMIKQGALFANMPQTLVKVRMEKDSYSRRRGMTQVKQELRFQKKLFIDGYVSLPRYLLNILLRVPPRFLPAGLLKIIYRFFLRRSYY